MKIVILRGRNLSFKRHLNEFEVSKGYMGTASLETCEPLLRGVCTVGFF
jgi:hypothetical protein